MKKLILLSFILCSLIGTAQERIDGSFDFETVSNKEYSLYIPSNYDPSVSNKMMLGMHPFNTNRWNSVSWCDTLIVFAETNNLILVCPDGGADGSIIDPIDLDFTTALLDSVHNWYNIDTDKMYIMGFSFGGRGTYLYGLEHADVFGGYIPIGAAITGLNEIGGLIPNATDEAFYLVHGGNDSPSLRFTPALDALDNNAAITNSILMPGVGHTIDFDNRNAILTDAFIWIDSVNCAQLNTVGVEGLDETGFNIELTPSSVNQGEQVSVAVILPSSDSIVYQLVDISGKVVLNERLSEPNVQHNFNLNTAQLARGIYLLNLSAGALHQTVKLSVE